METLLSILCGKSIVRIFCIDVAIQKTHSDIKINIHFFVEYAPKRKLVERRTANPGSGVWGHAHQEITFFRGLEMRFGTFSREQFHKPKSGKR